MRENPDEGVAQPDGPHGRRCEAGDGCLDARRRRESPDHPCSYTLLSGRRFLHRGDVRAGGLRGRDPGHAGEMGLRRRAVSPRARAERRGRCPRLGCEPAVVQRPHRPGGQQLSGDRSDSGRKLRARGSALHCAGRGPGELLTRLDSRGRLLPVGQRHPVEPGHDDRALSLRSAPRVL